MIENAFYLMIAELSGTLLGLAFVGITHHFSSLRTDLFSDPRVNLRAKALWTCVFDSAVLSLSLLLLPFCGSLLMLTITLESDVVKIGLGVLGLVWAGAMLVVFREKLHARRIGRTYEYESKLPLRFEDYVQLFLAVLVTGFLSLVLVVIGLLPMAFPDKSLHVSTHQIDSHFRFACVVYVIGGLIAIYNDLFSPYPLTTYPAEWALLRLPKGRDESTLQRIRRLLRLLPYKGVALGDGPSDNALEDNQSPRGVANLGTPATARLLAANLERMENAFRELVEGWRAGRDTLALLESGDHLDAAQLEELEVWLVEITRRKQCLAREIRILDSMIMGNAANLKRTQAHDEAEST